jgi:cytochrome c oxidase subunit 1
MWKGAMTFETPMLFCIGFLVLFTIGGFTGLMLSIAPADFQYHDSYFVVAHFHYVMVAGAVFSMTAAVYYWLPKWCGKMYNETMGKTHFWISFIGFNITFFPQHFVGLAGMPRRIPDYALQFADFNMMSSIGAFIYGASQLLFLYNVIATIVAGKPRVRREGLGRCRGPGVDGRDAGALPHLRDAAEDRPGARPRLSTDG